MGKFVVIGIGNPWRGDDAVGLRIADEVALQSWPETTAIALESLDPTLLAEAWASAACSSIVDAVKAPLPPGTILRLDLTADPLPGRLEAFSTHGIALRHALALARMLGDVPPKVVFYGIVGRNFAHGTELSPEVAAAARRLLRRLRRLCIWQR